MDSIPVLVLDPNVGSGSTDWPALLGSDFSVSVVNTEDAAISALESGSWAMVLADAREHAAVLKTIAGRWPRVLRLVTGRYNESNAAMRAVNEIGVFGVLPIPLTVAAVMSVFGKARLAYQEQLEQQANLTALEARVSEMQESSIASAAGIDPETNLWDRQHFIERLEDECNRLARYRSGFGVVAIDVVNASGELAIGAADLLRDFVRKVDVPARFERSTFVVLCPNTEAEGMKVLPGRVRDAFATRALPGSPEGQSVELTIATVAASEGPIASAEILGRLHEALDRARATGDTVHWTPAN
jgi:GGDEF domain-containing protein